MRRGERGEPRGSTSREIQIRRARATDEDFLRALSERVFAVYSRNPVGTTLAIIDEPGAITLVAEDQGLSLGFASIAFDALGRPFGPWRDPVLARLNAIAVRPDAFGRGVGRALLGRAEAAARDRGAVAMTLNTAESNARARALFTSAAFQTLYLVRGFYARGQSAFAMQKLL